VCLGRVAAAALELTGNEAFKRALLDAKSIAYLSVGSGIHVAGLIERLGIAGPRHGAERSGTEVTRRYVAVFSRTAS